MSTVPTPQGDVTLQEPPVELLRAIRSFLPFGAVRYSSPMKGADFGLVMQWGEREVYGVKQQPVDCDENQALVSYEANSILIAHSLAEYLRNGFSGLWMPCAYLRRKDGGRCEPGIAYFGYPRFTKDGAAIVYQAGGKLFLFTLADGSTKQVSTDPKADYRYPHGEATPN